MFSVIVKFSSYDGVEEIYICLICDYSSHNFWRFFPCRPSRINDPSWLVVAQSLGLSLHSPKEAITQTSLRTFHHLSFKVFLYTYFRMFYCCNIFMFSYPILFDNFYISINARKNLSYLQNMHWATHRSYVWIGHFVFLLKRYER